MYSTIKYLGTMGQKKKTVKGFHMQKERLTALPTFPKNHLQIRGAEILSNSGGEDGQSITED